MNKQGWEKKFDKVWPHSFDCKKAREDLAANLNAEIPCVEIERTQIKSFISSLLLQQEQQIMEMVSELNSRWSLCEDPKCENREDCDVANHYITKFKKDLDDLITRLENMK